MRSGFLLVRKLSRLFEGDSNRTGRTGFGGVDACATSGPSPRARRAPRRCGDCARNRAVIRNFLFGIAPNIVATIATVVTTLLLVAADASCRRRGGHHESTRWLLCVNSSAPLQARCQSGGCSSGEHVNPCAPLALVRLHRGDHTAIAGSFKFVQTSPMLREVRRLEKIHIYHRTERIQYQPGEAQCSTPPGSEQLPIQDPALPRPQERRDLVMVHPAWGKRSVHSEPCIRPLAEIGYFVHRTSVTIRVKKLITPGNKTTGNKRLCVCRLRLPLP